MAGGVISKYSRNTYATAFFTSSAASLNWMADWTFNPLSSISFFASTALVPCRRTIIGMLILPNLLKASITPAATRSQRTIPPKILMSIAFL